jgi:hypothetical protein
MRKTVLILCGLVFVSTLAAGSARAVMGGEEVELVGTTVPGQTAHARGRIDANAPGVLVFRADGPAGRAAQPDLAMPYDRMFEFGLTKEDAFHLGFFPAMFYGMVAPRPQRHTFTVSWHDAEGHAQEATFEISKDFSKFLLPVMYARARSACVRAEYGSCAPVVPPSLPPRVPLMPMARPTEPATAGTPVGAPAATPAGAPGEAAMPEAHTSATVPTVEP